MPRFFPFMRRVTFALLALTLSSCEVVEADESVGSEGSATPPSSTPPALSDLCRLSTTLLPGPTPQAVGAYCFGLSLGGGDALGCVATGNNITQCVDGGSGVTYGVQWTGSIGSAYAQALLGRVTQLSPSTYSVDLTDRQGRLGLAGQCSLINTSIGLQARFCAYAQ